MRGALTKGQLKNLTPYEYNELIYTSGRGSQSVKAAYGVQLKYDWSQIENSTAGDGKVWRFMQSGAQFRNGMFSSFV